MIPHHEMAVEMAESAQRRGEHAEVKRLADDVERAQIREIALLRRIGRDIERAGVEAGDIGVPEHMTGMGMAPTCSRIRSSSTASSWRWSPHHEGAIRMARVELERGAEPRLRRMAEEIIATQRREIEQMRAWSQRWYGAEPERAMHG
jgi:uncharacterized protein (DUF305 family)